MNYSYIFFGSPRFAQILLRDLLGAGHIPALVVCNPDRPVGRKGIVTPPPTKVLAQEHQIPVLQFEKIDEEAIEKIGTYVSAGTVGIVAAYSHILPPSLISLFSKGIVGVHPSLLPAYRGATPIQSVILNGETETGVTLYLIDEKVDHGDILSNVKFSIFNEDTYQTLEEKLAMEGAKLCMQTILDYLSGNIMPQKQDHARATFTKKFETKDGFVDLEKDDPMIIFRKARAFSHEPGVYAIQNGKRIKIQDAALEGSNVIITKITEEGEKPKDVRVRL